MIIRTYHIGKRHKNKNWKLYIIPKNTVNKDNAYYKFKIYWLCFYLYKPKRCDKCNIILCQCGGIYNNNNKKILCRHCYSKFYHIKEEDRFKYKCKTDCRLCIKEYDDCNI